ncbi:hypothetical protein EB796_023607 [Bugula neritina]|uniref:Uncharacterized protein n=1 Tax=Bugula neritina TaxID=10212 RepID=A0A7J7IY03_BUGNE|nr:hypothetical protein EB796_023607 [Bugula neritina]
MQQSFNRRSNVKQLYHIQLHRPENGRFDCQLTETAMIYGIIEHVYTTKLAYCQQTTLHFWILQNMLCLRN